MLKKNNEALMSYVATERSGFRWLSLFTLDNIDDRTLFVISAIQFRKKEIEEILHKLCKTL